MAARAPTAAGSSHLYEILFINQQKKPLSEGLLLWSSHLEGGLFAGLNVSLIDQFLHDLFLFVIRPCVQSVQAVGICRVFLQGVEKGVHVQCHVNLIIAHCHLNCWGG